MVFDVILGAIQALLVWLGGLLPASDLDITGPLNSVISYANDLDYFIPISEVFAFTIAAFILFPALAGASLLTWLVALIRGGSARA